MKELPSHITSDNINIVVFPTKHHVPDNIVVFPTKHHVPDNIEAFQHDVSDCGGIVAGVDDILEGRSKSAGFIFAMPILDGGEIKEIIRIGLATIDGKPTMRFLGENGSAEGAGSHSVVASYYQLDRALIAATVAHYARTPVILRLHNDYL